MREAKCWKRSIARRESSKPIDHARKLAHDEIKRVAQDQDISVAHDILTGRTKVNHGACFWRHITKRVHMRHDIVAQSRFVRSSNREVDVIEMRANRFDLRARHGHAEFVLAFGKCQPNAAPR